MPFNKYFHGEGDKVMSEMQKRYGAKKGKSVFYATAKKKDQEPEDKQSRKRKGALKALKGAKHG